MPFYWIPTYIRLVKMWGSKINSLYLGQEFGEWCYYPEQRNLVYYFQHEVPGPDRHPNCLPACVNSLARVDHKRRVAMLTWLGEQVPIITC